MDDEFQAQVEQLLVQVPAIVGCLYVSPLTHVNTHERQGMAILTFLSEDGGLVEASLLRVTFQNVPDPDDPTTTAWSASWPELFDKLPYFELEEV
jgi:hypothetical protein